jgi:hypothetical protein
MPPAWKAIWPLVFWAAWGLWLAVADLQNADVQPAVLRLLVGGGVLGFARPNTWLLWAIALSAWVPLEPFVAQVLHLPDTFRSTLLGMLLPLVPALVGGYLGRTLARIARRR